ncbi:MAG: cation:proton antiporter [Deltaproteobacteria bacterium]|nr:MAG: cation:proton antiporter [Deltaproteobacteria bacterium]
MIQSFVELIREIGPLSDPVQIFALVMVIILVAPLVFTRLRIPGIVGLIVVGALVGPSAAGWLERDETIQLLGTVGLLYLMFTAGLSMDLGQFQKLRGRSVGFGLVSFAIPMVLALIVGTQVMGYSMATSLLLGSVVGSHTLLAYPMAVRLGIAQSPAVTVTTGGTLVTDTLSLLVLAVVVANAAGDADRAFWVTFGAGLVAFLIYIMVVVPRVGRLFFRTVRNEPTTEFGFLLVILFVTAVLAEVAGLAPIVGAFAAGLALNSLVPDTGTLMGRIQFVGEALFIPFFLLSVGMLVDFSVLFGELGVWITAAVFTGLVVIGKASAAWTAGLVLRMRSFESWTMTGLTIPQAAATLAVTLIAFELFDPSGERVFSAEMVNGVVIMILATCLVGPSLVERFGRQLALAEEERPYDPSDAPERILIPLANPATADALIDLSLMIRRGNEPLFPLTVARDGADVDAQVAASERLLAHAVKHAAAADVPVNPLTRVDMNVAAGIVRAVKERRASTIVIGWNGKVTTRDRMFGSVLDQLIGDTAATTLVCHLCRPLSVTERVVLAVPPFAERDPGFGAVVRAARRLAARSSASLLVLTSDECFERVDQRINAVGPDVETETVAIGQWGHMTDAIGRHVRKDDLLIVITARQGTLAWQPEFIALPFELGQRFSELNFVIAYPPGVETLQQARSETLPATLGVRVSEVRHQVAAATVEAVLSDLLRAHFPNSPTAVQRLREQLLARHGNALELIGPSILLLDGHSPIVNEPILLVAECEAAIGVGDNGDVVRQVAVFLSPMDRKAHEHLRDVSAIAGHLRASTFHAASRSPFERLGVGER